MASPYDLSDPNHPAARHEAQALRIRLLDANARIAELTQQVQDQRGSLRTLFEVKCDIEDKAIKLEAAGDTLANLVHLHRASLPEGLGQLSRILAAWNEAKG